MAKSTRKFNPESALTALPVAAGFIGLPYSTLANSGGDTVCLNLERIENGNRVFFYTRQVLLHAAYIQTDGRCGGRCKVAADRARAEAQQIIEQVVFQRDSNSQVH